MFKSKKGDVNILLILFIIMIFSVVLLLGIIFAYILFVAGHDYAVLPLYNAGVLSNQSPEIQTGFENTVESYEGFDINTISDNLWFFSYIFMSIIAYVFAYKSRNTNFFSFLSMLTYGIMLILYIFSFFLIIINWLYSDVLLNLFINFIPNLPKLDWWVSNAGIVILIQATTLLLIKTIDFDFTSWKNRRKADGGDFDNEIL